jgi:hypothetical protein
MRYFTPELYLRLQDFSSDKAMGAADRAWDEAVRRYRRLLRRVLPELPRGLRSLVEDFYLHDAEVLSMGRKGQTFVMVLRLDVPPRELLVLTYRLTGEAVINAAAFAPQGDSGPAQWMYDEVVPVRGNSPHWSHSILLSNGWEVRLRVSDVEVVRTDTVYPAPGTILVPVSTSAVSQSA